MAERKSLVNSDPRLARRPSEATVDLAAYSDAYDAGVAAERERCAALLDARAARTAEDLRTVGWSRAQIAAMRHLCEAVAKEIRNGGKTDG